MGERRPITLHLLGSWDLAVQGAPVQAPQEPRAEPAAKLLTARVGLAAE